MKESSLVVIDSSVFNPDRYYYVDRYLETMICDERGKYAFGSYEYQLITYDKPVESEQALADCLQNSWKPAGLQRMLDYLAKNPNPENDNWIVALGVREPAHNKQICTLIADSGKERRSLYLNEVAGKWNPMYSFLRFRNL